MIDILSVSLLKLKMLILL